MKMAVDMGLFQMLDGPTKIQDLQKKTGADPYVLRESKAQQSTKIACTVLRERG